MNEDVYSANVGGGSRKTMSNFDGKAGNMMNKMIGADHLLKQGSESQIGGNPNVAGTRSQACLTGRTAMGSISFR